MKQPESHDAGPSDAGHRPDVASGTAAGPSKPETFEEFWPYYVSQHLNPTSRKCHFVGTTLAMGALALSPWQPALLLAVPVLGYGGAWIGHFAFEKNKPATWAGGKYILWSLRGDLRMWTKMVAGTMDTEVEQHLANTNPAFA